MGFKLLQAPTSEPVTLDEAKLYARIYVPNDDDLVTDLITSARETVETFLNKKIITQKWRMYLDAFPGYIDQRLGGNIVTAPIAIGATSYMAGIRWAIVPQWGPVQSIDAVSFIGPDQDGSQVNLTVNTDYLVDAVSIPARITPPFGKFWPISRIVTNSVWVDWTVGYGGNITVSIDSGSSLLTGGNFKQSDIGASITIPGAGADADLITTIQSVAVNGNATLAATASASVADVAIYWGTPVPSSIKTAIKQLVADAYETRQPMPNDEPNMPVRVKRLLYQHRDLRL